MSRRYKGAIISATPPTTSAAPPSASGEWTLQSQAQAQAAATWPSAVNYIEDVFSTYFFTGTGAAQTITNNINVSGSGGLVWVKSTSNSLAHSLYDTARGTSSLLYTNSTSAADTQTQGVTAFNNTGYSLGTYSISNGNGNKYTSWTFRKQPKFFDIVTWTGDGVADRAISHNLGSTPGCIIVKSSTRISIWRVWHRSFSNTLTDYLGLDRVTGVQSQAGLWGTVAPNSTSFHVGSESDLNQSGQTYVAYLFAHDAGGFGESGNDNVVSCGSFTSTGATATVSLGYEPQWLMVKMTTADANWWVVNNINGTFNNVTGYGSAANDMLWPNLVDLQGNDTGYGVYLGPTATGFQHTLNAGSTYVYVAIRRGPMRTPTSGTTVFMPVARSGTGANATVTAGFPPDFVIEGNRNSTTAGVKFGMWDRLRNLFYWLSTSTAVEASAGTTIVQSSLWNSMTGINVGTTSTLTNASSNQFVYWMFRRAPKVFDTICYVGNNTTNTQSHNLGVAPELIITKRRDVAITDATFFFNFGVSTYLACQLGSTGGADTDDYINYGLGAAPSSTTVAVKSNGAAINASGSQYVMELFATLPGVSKVGTYTGNGSTQNIDCGFTTGVRFLLIKRYDSTGGNYYIWDTARGITSTYSPSLSLNAVTAESTLYNSITPSNPGFTVNQIAATNINVSSGTYVYLALA